MMNVRFQFNFYLIGFGVNQMHHKPQTRDTNICFVLNMTEYYFNAKYNRLPLFYFHLKHKIIYNENEFCQCKQEIRNCIKWNKCLLTQTNTNRIGFYVSIFDWRVLWFIYKHSVYNLLTSNLWKRKSASCTTIKCIQFIIFSCLQICG